MMSEMANHTTSGMSAMAVSRCAHRKRDAGRAMQDRHDRGELPLVDLKVGRQRPVGWPIGDAHRAKPLFAYVGTVLARGDIKSMKLGSAHALSPGFSSEIRWAR